MQAPFPWLRWLGWAFLASVMALGFWYFKDRFKFPAPKRRETFEAKPEELPRVWLRNQLRILTYRLEPLEDLPTAPDSWIAIVKEFLEREAGVPARAWTSADLQSRTTDLPEGENFLALVRQCELYQFSPGFRKSHHAKRITLDWISQVERLFP
jgi:hypothetical protein